MVTATQPATDRATRIREVLATVADPEIPAVSVLDLGIVREIDRDGRSVAITPTYSGCPATAAIETNIRAALAAANLDDVRLVTSSRRSGAGLPPLRFARDRGGQPVRLDAVQGPVAVSRLRRTLRPLQVPLNGVRHFPSLADR